MNLGFLTLLALAVVVAAVVVPLILKQIAGNCTRSLPLGSPVRSPSALRLLPITPQCVVGLRSAAPGGSAVPVTAANLPYRKKDYQQAVVSSQ